MTYRFFKTEAEANVEVSRARAEGRRSYMLGHHAGRYEVRIWG